MSRRAKKLIYNWETTRFELLNTRICDLGLKIEGTKLAGKVRWLYRDLALKKLSFKPPVYLSDSWGCPDRNPVIGVPFYLADDLLSRIEEEQAGSLEDDLEIMMLLRHEAGHAYNYAYKLFEHPGWEKTFGKFDAPYRDRYHPDPRSRRFVRHVEARHFGQTYAQKHPDEDFAETFAVWLTPRSGWRDRYRSWPAMSKLRYVDRVMKMLRGKRPVETGEAPEDSTRDMQQLLVEYYGLRLEKYQAQAQGYVDDFLIEIFAGQAKWTGVQGVHQALKENGRHIVKRVSHWTGLDEEALTPLLLKMIERSRKLKLRVHRADLEGKLTDITAVMATLAMNYAYTGKFLVNFK